MPDRPLSAMAGAVQLTPSERRFVAAQLGDDAEQYELHDRRSLHLRGADEASAEVTQLYLERADRRAAARVLLYTVDDAGGVSVEFDLDEWLHAQRDAHGLLTTALSSKLALQPANEDITVLIRLALDVPPLDRKILRGKPIGSAFASARAEAARQVADLSQRRADLVAAVEQVTGRTVPAPFRADGAYVNPFIIMNLHPAAVERLRHKPGIVSLVADGPVEWTAPREEPSPTPTPVPSGVEMLWHRPRPSFEDCLVATQIDEVHRTRSGKGIRIAVVENHRPQSLRVTFDDDRIMDPNAKENYHITWTISVIQHENGGLAGVAPQSTVLVANGGIASVPWVERCEWARSQHADIISVSARGCDDCAHGDLSGRDIYFDELATRFPWPLVVVCAGNTRSGTNCNCDETIKVTTLFASGKGVNVLSVADVTIDDEDVGRVGKVATSSLYGNPRSPANDHEVPGIAMVGTSYLLPWNRRHAGSSAATAAVAGVAALVLETDPRLRLWPESVRAILCATADREADDAPWDPKVDGKDGAGLVNAAAACAAAEHFDPGMSEPATTGHDHHWIAAGRLASGQVLLERTVVLPEGGSRVRVALCWSGSVSPYQPELAELDLELVGSGATESSRGVGTSTELVDAVIGGPVTLRVSSAVRQRVPAFAFGVAWAVLPAAAETE